MPDGKHHHEVWRKGWKIALPLAFSTYAIFDPVSSYECYETHCISGNTFIALGVVIGYALGRYIDGDLDQMGTTASEGRLVNEIPVFGVFLYGHWATYGAIFRRHHRSFWTHFPGVSTVIRILYQFYGLFLILFLKDWIFFWIILVFFGIFIGLTFADFLHWREDKKSGELKKVERSRKRNQYL